MKNLLLDFSKNEKSFVGFFHKMKLKDSLLRPQRTNAGTIRIIFIVLGTSFQGYWTSKKKQDLVFSVKLRFLRLEKLPKNGCPKNVQILWGPKQAIMVQIRPYLNPKSKLKSNIH